MDVLVILGVVNVVLWGVAFGALWWASRTSTAVDAQLAALERQVEQER